MTTWYSYVLQHHTLTSQESDLDISGVFDAIGHEPATSLVWSYVSLIQSRWLHINYTRSSADERKKRVRYGWWYRQAVYGCWEAVSGGRVGRSWRSIKIFHELGSYNPQEPRLPAHEESAGIIHELVRQGGIFLQPPRTRVWLLHRLSENRWECPTRLSG